MNISSFTSSKTENQIPTQRILTTGCTCQLPAQAALVRVSASDPGDSARDMKPKAIIVNDRMQREYCYLLTKPAGRCFPPEFLPDITPRQMLELGVFGGKYMTDCRHEFPASWFKKAKLSPEKADPRLNYFKVSASKPLSYWVEKGWIHPQDPRGWFQWYCRYYMGRRSDDDMRQIKRWKGMQRHIAQLIKHCRKGDTTCRPVQRQALLHWAYDSRKI